MADPGLMKGGFSGDPRILAVGVLTAENGAVVHKVRHKGLFLLHTYQTSLDYYSKSLLIPLLLPPNDTLSQCTFQWKFMPLLHYVLLVHIVS